MNKGMIVLLIVGLLSSAMLWWPTVNSAAINTDTSTKLLNNTDALLQVDDITQLHVSSWPLNASKAISIDAELRDGMWIITNHHNFPADLASRIGTIIGAVINLKRGPLISADTDRHAELHIHDPLIPSALHSLAFGKHITLKNKYGDTVLDLIFGRYDQELERSYVRFAGDDRVYTSTAYLYLDADWKTWTKRPVFEHSFEQCLTFEFQAFSDKPFRTKNLYSLNPKTFQWEYRQDSINTAHIKEYSEYLTSIKFNDALPINTDTIPLLEKHGMTFDQTTIQSAPTQHRVHCRDESVYDIYVSDTFLDASRPSDEQEQQYLIIKLTPGSNSSESYRYRCQHFAFVVDHHFLEVIDQTPAIFIR